MSEQPNDILGHIVALEGLHLLVEKLHAKGWKARVRENTAKTGEYHLHVNEDLFSFMTRPITKFTHHLSGKLTLENPAALKSLKQLSEDFEELGMEYSLKVTDEEGASYIHTFGHVG